MRIFPPTVDAFATGARQKPDLSSAPRFIAWLMRSQRPLLLLRAVMTTLWQLPGVFIPLLAGKAIDEGIASHDWSATIFWSGLLALIVLVNVTLGIVTHTLGVSSWLIAFYTINSLVTRKSTQMGHVLTRRAPAGEILSVAGSDADVMGMITEVGVRIVGSIAAVSVTVMLMFQLSPRLGFVVMVLTPLMVLGAWPLLKPLGEARTVERTRSSKLTGQATDIVAGLRVLRGIGGEQTFGDNYAHQSQRVKQAGLRTAAWRAGVDSFSVLMSGLLLVSITWLGVTEMRRGNISVGALMSFFGWSVFLTSPLRQIFEFAQKWTQSLVAATKTIAVLRHNPPWAAEHSHVRCLDPDQPLIDHKTGFVAQPGKFTIVVSAIPDDSAALADRLGRYLPSDQEPIKTNVDEDLKGKAAKLAREKQYAERDRIVAMDEELGKIEWGVSLGTDLAAVSMDEVRRTIMVSDTAQGLFKGTLQQAVDPHAQATRHEAERALHTAAAEDVYDGLPGGWQGRLDERGRGLSGGQRQRIVLARSLLANPPVLILVEPTSAVDAHTEARIAARLGKHRQGQTTVIMSASPLLLHYADDVVLLVDGVVKARGTHEMLLATDLDYRRVVARDLDQIDAENNSEQVRI